MKLVQCNEYVISTVDTDGLVLYWGVNVQSREYRHVDTRLKTGNLLYFTLLYSVSTTHFNSYNLYEGAEFLKLFSKMI